MQIKKKFTDESFGTADQDVILNKPNMADTTIEGNNTFSMFILT